MRTKSWVGLTLTLIILATCLQLGGVASPMWVWLSPSNYTIGVGLYYRVGCESSTGDVCPDVTQNLEFGYTDVDTFDRSHWPHLVWLQTVAGALGIVLTVEMLVYLCGLTSWQALGTLNLAMTFTAVCVWLPIAAGLILYAVKHGEVITKSTDVSSLSFPWSALMCFLAGLLFVIITILVRTKCRPRRAIKHAIPLSADSKMLLNPSTKSRLTNRFFAPSAFREDNRQVLGFSDQSALLGSRNGSASRNVGNALVNHGMEHGESRGVTNGHVARLATGYTAGHHSKGISTIEDSQYRPREEMPTPQIRRPRHEHQQEDHHNQNVTSRTTTTTTMQHEARQYGQQRQSAAQTGKNVILNKHVADHTFTDSVLDTDEETIYYTGRPRESRTRPLHVLTDGYSDEATIRQAGYGPRVSQEMAISPQVREHLRFGASEDIRNMSQYTVQTQAVASSANERIVLSANKLQAEAKYNDLYIYRPYSEHVY